jgi:putative CocE/NonD family hydrolase
MSFGSRLLALYARLPPAITRDISVQQDLGVPTPDGTVLWADRYFSRNDDRAPIVLLRTPYGRRGLAGIIGRTYAERGFQAVVQSVRGTFGSGGEFDPFHHEASDGRATLEWLAAQPWFGGSVGMAGPSYLGFVQWAVAGDAPDSLKALAIQVSASQFRDLVYPGGSFSLDTGLSWIHTVHNQERPLWRNLPSILLERRRLAPAFAHLPLRETDRMVTGERVPYFQDWLVHEQPGDPFWKEIDHSGHMDTVSPAVGLVGGWYDLFLPQQLEDYRALRAAGKQPYLTIGPWTHASPGLLLGTGLKEDFVWLDAHLRGETSQLRALPVRLYVMGAKRWIDLPDWPPPSAPEPHYLHPGGTLSPNPPPASPPDRYRYDPANPTPAVGGVVLGPHAGAKDNRKLEARSDVLTYTGEPLQDDLQVVGPVSAELYVRSSLEHTDFFTRLCDVHPNGRSINVCDGLQRLEPGQVEPAGDGTVRVQIELWPTAHRFAAGHRLRLQVSSGAHPRFARNPGSGEALASATRLEPAQQEIFHDPEHPSAVVLPVLSSAR